MAEYVTGQRERRRVAVVGSGVAGLTAAHVFASAGRHVTLYEADHRLGGHADTHLVDGMAIDTGFIVHNPRTYPVLLRLFAELGVATQPSEMSMSITLGSWSISVGRLFFARSTASFTSIFASATSTSVSNSTITLE